VNGERIFCRGACWTPLDVVSLNAPRDDYAHILGQVRDAGMNMLRVGGTMVYESDDFLDLCDEYGILVWQDLMFANMDYPDGDEGFVAAVTTELRQQLERLLPRASVAVICGNSEVEQQAAMWGAPRERWQPRLFHEIVPALLADLSCGVPYWPSSAHGGAFPHQPDRGTTSYYGVGAYLRPLEDARRSEVRFATETLGFASRRTTLPPCPAAGPACIIRRRFARRAISARADFDDVRDFYLKTCLTWTPELRYADHDRTCASRRHGRSDGILVLECGAPLTCDGAFHSCAIMRSGMGSHRSLGEPKAAWHALCRGSAAPARDGR
jgi:beta-mannosidase